MTDKKDLEKQAPAGALARPDFIKKGDFRGTEDLTKDDLQLPRIGLAQGLSPQLLEGNPKYIPDLKIGDMFNNLTGKILGRGPFEFTVVRRDKPRGIQFNPLSEGGGIKDFNVPLTDPRMNFGPNGEKPLATKFFDFVLVFLPVNLDDPFSNLIALSLKSSGLKVARELNTYMKMRSAPTFAGKYTLTSAMETNKKGTFAVFKVKNSSVEDESTDKGRPGWVSQEVYNAMELVYEGIKDRVIDIEREPGSDDGDDIPDLTGGAAAGGSPVEM